MTIPRRRLGRTGLRVSELACGTWALGGAVEVDGIPFGWANRAHLDGAEALERAFELGVNLVDTAPTYGFGVAESVLGEVLTGSRHGPDVIVCSKAGREWCDGWVSALSEASLSRSVDRTLKRIRRDSLDILLLKDPKVDEVMASDAIASVERLRHQGLVHHIGFSTHSPATAAQLIRTRAFDVVEIEFSIIKQSAKSIFELAQEHDVGLICWAPSFFGWLSGKYNSLEQFPEDDWRRSHFSRMPAEVIEWLVEATAAIQTQFDTPRRSAMQTALRFVLQQNAFASVLVGMRSVGQAEENVGTSYCEPLTLQQMSWLTSLDAGLFEQP